MRTHVKSCVLARFGDFFDNPPGYVVDKPTVRDLIEWMYEITGGQPDSWLISYKHYGDDPPDEFCLWRME